MTKNDGGPAYPVWELNGAGEAEMTCFGKSIRDSFAEKAMQGIISIGDSWPLEVDLQYAAKLSYKMADAMLKAREE